MPIQITRITSGLYLNTWVGRVTIEDVHQSEQEGAALMQAGGESRVVLINDLTQVTHVPMDLQALRRVAENNRHIIALIVVKAPAVVRLVGEAQAKLANWHVEFLDTLEQARERGHELLEHN